MRPDTLRFAIALASLLPSASVFVLWGWPWGLAGATVVALLGFGLANRVFEARASREEKQRDLRYRIDTDD